LRHFFSCDEIVALFVLFKNVVEKIKTARDTSKFMSLDAATKKRHSRIRFMKKFLRKLPRRSNLHRYPGLRLFQKAARKRDYLWSWHRAEMIRAFYMGWIIALIPMYGLQMLAAFIMSFPCRANCIVAMALQWITNPLTIGPILVFQYLLGDKLLKSFMGFKGIDNGFVEIFKHEDFWIAIRKLATGHNVAYIIEATLFGGFIIAIVGATLNTLLYLYCTRSGAEQKILRVK